MFEVGDAVPLRVSPLDGDRNAVDIAGLGLVVTRPDGTSTEPISPTHDGLGSYSASFTATQAGRHVVRWAGTGFVETDVFNVWPVDPRYLFNLDDARKAIGNTGDDDQLRLYIAATTDVIEDIVGPLVGRTRSAAVDGGVPAILIAPGSTVVSVTENGTALTTGSYVVDETAGIVYAGSAQSSRCFARGRGNVVVESRAGGVIPPNVLLAAIEEFRFLWQQGQQGNRPQFGSDPDTEAWTPSGFAVPRRVVELCAGNRRGPVVA